MPKRQQRSATEWQHLIEQQARSGMSGLAFCRQHGLQAKTFYLKRQLLSNQSVVKSTEAFIQVQSSPAPTRPIQAGFVLQVGDIRLQLSADVDAQWLAQLMKTLS